MLMGKRGQIVVPDQSIYEQSVSAKHSLGDVLVLGDRMFRYAKAGGIDLALAYMTSGPAMVANHTDVVQAAYGMTKGQTVVNVLLTATTPTADQYKDGWLVVNKGTGLGQVYRIKSHTLATTPCVVTLYDPIVTTVPATSEITLVAPLYRAVVVTPVTAANAVAGVPLIGVTAAYYFWAQRRGPAPLVVDTGDTPVVGEALGYPATPAVPGACGISAVTDHIWGICRYPAIFAEIALVDLMLE